MVSFPTLSRPQTTRASRFLLIFNAITGVFGMIFVFGSFYARSRVPAVRSLAAELGVGGRARHTLELTHWYGYAA